MEIIIFPHRYIHIKYVYLDPFVHMHFCFEHIIINALLSLVMRLYTRVLEIFDQFMIQNELFANHTYKQ